MRKTLTFHSIIGMILLCMVVYAGPHSRKADFASVNESIDALPAALLKGAEEAYKINMQGLDALFVGDLDSAASCFSRAQELLAIYPDAQNNMGVVHFRRGNVSQAAMVWKSVIEKDPSYYIAYYNLGIYAFEEKKTDPAIAYFTKAININKKFVEGYIMLGRAENAIGRIRDALARFKAAYAIAPDREESWQFYSFGLISSGDTLAAQSILAKHQDNATALRMLGQIAASKKDYKNATALFSKAIAKGESPDQLLELSQTQIEQHACKDALVTLGTYLAKSPNPVADAYLYSGIAAKECGDIAGARAWFEKGIAKYPSDQILTYNLGQIYFYEKKFDKAENMWNSLGDSLDDPSLSYLRAINAKRTGNTGLAETFVRKALKRDERPEFYDFLGTLLYSQGKKDEAAASFKAALRLDPDYRSAQLNLALLTQSPDELEHAAQELEKSITECRSKCQDPVLQLSIVYYHQAKLDKAALVLDKVPDGEKTERIFRHLALYYRDLHEWEKAAGVIEKARKYFVIDTQLEYELAEDYLLSGSTRKAIDALVVLLGKWESNPWRILYQLGYAYVEVKEFDKAKNYLQQSLKKKPDNPAASGLMAYILNAEGNVEQARLLWEKNLRDDPSNFSLLVNMGLSFEKDGRFEDALSYYRKALLLKPSDQTLQINIGNALVGLGRNREAMDAFGIALSSPKRELAAYDMFLLAQKIKSGDKVSEMLAILAKEFPTSQYTLRASADMQVDKGDTAGALAKLESLREKDSGDWLTLARMYALRKSVAKTNECLDKVPDAEPDKKVKTGIRALLEFSCGNYARAMELWKNLGDSTFATQYNMALSAYKTKNFAEAFSISERIVSKANGADRAEVIVIAANSAMAQKQWKPAMQWYQQLENSKPNDPVVQYNLAVVSYNLGSMEESWVYYQKAKKLDPTVSNADIEKRYASVHGSGQSGALSMDSVDTWYNDAVTLQADGRDTAAEVLYKKILDKNPGYVRGWNNLGAIYSGRGDLKQAEDCYHKSIEKQHDLPEVYANLINVYIAMENYKEAQRWVVKGRGHNPDSEILQQLEAKVKELNKKK